MSWIQANQNRAIWWASSALPLQSGMKFHSQSDSGPSGRGDTRACGASIPSDGDSKTGYGTSLHIEKDLRCGKGAQNKWWCGLAKWQDQNVVACTLGRLNEFRELQASGAGSVLLLEDKDNLPELIGEIFQWAGGPIQFGDLVDLVADILSVLDINPIISYDSEEHALVSSLQDEEPSVDTKLAYREYLELVWQEVCQLPLQQRQALLFNLRDPRGHDMTAMFARTRVAMLAELADALDLTPEEFAELSMSFPMEDLLIAERLGVTRQQVINLRISARRRLTRRVKKLGEKRS